MNHNFVANFPALYLVTNGPNDARRIRARDVIGLLVAVKRANRLAKGRPYAVVVHARSHHEDEDLVAVEGRDFDDFFEHGLVGITVTLAADRPGIHLLGHVPHGRHLAHFVQVLLRRVIHSQFGVRVQSHTPSPLNSQLPRRRIASTLRCNME